MIWPLEALEGEEKQNLQSKGMQTVGKEEGVGLLSGPPWAFLGREEGVKGLLSDWREWASTSLTSEGRDGAPLVMRVLSSKFHSFCC